MRNLLRSMLAQFDRKAPRESAQTADERRLRSLSDEDLNRLHRQAGDRGYGNNDDTADRRLAINEYFLTEREIARRVAGMSDEVIAAHRRRLSEASRTWDVSNGDWDDLPLKTEVENRERRRQMQAEAEHRAATRATIAATSDAELKAELALIEKILAKHPRDSHSLRKMTDIVEEIERREAKRKQESDQRDIARTRAAMQALRVSKISLAIAIISAVIAFAVLMRKGP